MLVSKLMAKMRPAAAALLVTCVSTVAFSATSFAACTNDPDAAKKASDFIGNPASFLNGPNGPRSTDDVTADVESFVTANPLALPAVLAVLKDLTAQGASTSGYQKAIGTGLGKAANTCKTTDFTFSLEIQGNLGATGSTDANGQYAAITGNDPTRSVALSGAASGGSVGGSTTQPVSSPNTVANFQTFAPNSVSNNPTNYFSSSVSSAGTPGGGTTTIVCTVSSTC